MFLKYTLYGWSEWFLPMVWEKAKYTRRFSRLKTVHAQHFSVQFLRFLELSIEFGFVEQQVWVVSGPLREPNAEVLWIWFALRARYLSGEVCTGSREKAEELAGTGQVIFSAVN